MKRIKVHKRDGVWTVDPNGVGGCKQAMHWRTYEDALDDVGMICHAERMIHNNRKRNT